MKRAIKLTLIAIGSRGDVQSVIALGKGLHAAGYAVRVVTLASFEKFIRAQELEFHPVYGNADLLSMYRDIMRSFGAITESYVETFSAQSLRDSDAILSQLPGGFYGYDLGDSHALEWRTKRVAVHQARQLSAQHPQSPRLFSYRSASKNEIWVRAICGSTTQNPLLEYLLH